MLPSNLPNIHGMKLVNIRKQVKTINTTIGLTLNRVHNSRRPLDRLFAPCDPVKLTFNLLSNRSINWWARHHDGLSPCQVW